MSAEGSTTNGADDDLSVVVMVTSENWPGSCYKQAAFTVDAPGFGRMLGSSIGGIDIVVLALVILE